VMSAFDRAWNVLKMGTYEEEERDMGNMPGKKGGPWDILPGKTNPPYPDKPDFRKKCEKCGKMYMPRFNPYTNQEDGCPHCGWGGAPTNLYGAPPGAPSTPSQPLDNTLGFPKDWQTTNMTSNPPQ